MALKSILGSGYVWDVQVADKFNISAWVESDHKSDVAYRTKVHLGPHRVISSSCTCTTVASKICKHRAGLLYACVILANNMLEKPSWLPRWPNYSRWLDTIAMFIPCKGYDDMLLHLWSSLPGAFSKVEEKKKNQLVGALVA